MGFLETWRLLCFQFTDHMPRPDRGTSGSENSRSPTDPIQNLLLSLELLPSGQSHHSLWTQLEPSQLAAVSLVIQAPTFRAPYTGCCSAGRVVWKEAEEEEEREQEERNWNDDLWISPHCLQPCSFLNLILLPHK